MPKPYGNLTVEVKRPWQCGGRRRKKKIHTADPQNVIETCLSCPYEKCVPGCNPKIVFAQRESGFDPRTLYDWRKKAGLTITQLAEKSGVSMLTISAYENGQDLPTQKTASKLAKALGITTKQYLGISKK